MWSFLSPQLFLHFAVASSLSSSSSSLTLTATIQHHTYDVPVPETTTISYSPGGSPKLTVSPDFKAFRHSIYASGTKNHRRSPSPESLSEMASSSSGGGISGPSARPSSSSSSSAATAPHPSGPTSSNRKTSVSAKATSDPILRNTLRYTISAREYAQLHKYVLSRNRQIKKRVPSIETVNRIMNGGAAPPRHPNSSNHGNINNESRTTSGGDINGKDKEKSGSGDMDIADVASTSAGLDAGAGAMVGADDFNARAVRHSLRVFGVTAVAMKTYGLILQRYGGMKRE